MKAILATAAGGPEVLQLQDVALPDLPSPQHIRIKLHAAGINPLDTKLRAKPSFYPDKLPAILGCDGAGVVESVGTEVTRFNLGDEVYFCHGGLGDEAGCYAEYTTLHQEYCAKKPYNLSLQDSAALPLVLLTAWEALVDRANLQAGQTLLIHGGAGGVGHVALQLAHHLGARIAVTVSGEKQAGLCKALGAEKTIIYTEQDFVSATLDWTDGKGADVIFDTVGADIFVRSMSATRIGGKLVSILAMPLSQADVQLARQRNLSLCFELMLTPQLLKQHHECIRQRVILESCAKLVEQGELGVLVSHRLPLEQADEAHRLLEQGGMIGKMVLII